MPTDHGMKKLPSLPYNNLLILFSRIFLNHSDVCILYKIAWYQQTDLRFKFTLHHNECAFVCTHIRNAHINYVIKQIRWLWLFIIQFKDTLCHSMYLFVWTHLMFACMCRQHVWTISAFLFCIPTLIACDFRISPKNSNEIFSTRFSIIHLHNWFISGQ